MDRGAWWVPVPGVAKSQTQVGMHKGKEDLLSHLLVTGHGQGPQVCFGPPFS